MKPERINLQSPVGMVIGAFVGTVGSIASIVFIAWGSMEGFLGLLFAAPIGYVCWRHLLHGLEHLRLDVAAGTVQYIVGKHVNSVPLDQLGPLTITKYNRNPQLRARVRQLVWWHKLEAAGLPRVILSETIDPKPTEAMKAKFERAIAASAARKILATAHGEDGGYRAAPEVRSQLSSAVPDATRLREALDLLAADADPAIQARAKELRSS